MKKNDFNVTLNLGGKMQALTLAASAAGDLLDGNWHYSIQGKRNFVVSVSSMYQVTTTSAAADDQRVLLQRRSRRSALCLAGGSPGSQHL